MQTQSELQKKIELTVVTQINEKLPALVKTLIKETIQPVMQEQANRMEEQMKTLILPKIEAVVKHEGQMSNIKKIIQSEFNDVLSREILPRLENQIGDMLKNMQDVNMKVC